MVVNTEKFLEILHFHNSWWLEKKVPDALLMSYQRPMLKTLLSYIELNRIVVLKGPRRTGKTTIFYQLISHLLESGVDPTRILFLSFDDLEVRRDFDEIVKCFQQATKQTIRKGREVFFFLDEIQNLENWTGVIKRYFDRKIPIRFFLSGSSATMIKRGTESLAGRTVEEILWPLGFREFLEVRANIPGLSKEIRSIRKKDPFRDLPSKDALVPYETQIKIVFDEYLNRGGFPHLLSINDRFLWRKLLREDVIEKVIYRDLVELYQIKKPMVLEKLFLYLAEHSSELLNITNVANSLGLSREYTEIYFDYLQKAFLLFKTPKYSGSIEKQIRSMEKCYVSDPGLMKLGLNFESGKVVETVVANHLRCREIFYWRNQHYEVDFILKHGKTLLPIEVKNKEEIKPGDIRGVIHFLEMTDQKLGIVVSKALLQEREICGKRIMFIPAWLFLLLPIADFPQS